MIEKEVVLEVKNLKKYFPASHKRVLKAVDDVSFTIHKGETFGIVGESGCGKTTCGKTCTGILTKTDGQVLYQGKDVHQMSKAERNAFTQKVQTIFQDPYASLDPHQKVYQIVSEGMRIHHLTKSKEEEQKRVMQQAAPEAEFRFTVPADVTAEDVRWADAVLGNVPVELIRQNERLEWFQSNTAGPDAYLAPGVLPERCVVTNATGAYGLAISEWMLGMWLGLQKDLFLYRDRQNRSEWAPTGHSVRSVYGSRVLCVGMGDIGSNFARRAHALGAEVVGVRRTVHPDTPCPDYCLRVVAQSQLDEELPEADLIALSLPGTPETNKLFNAERFTRCKDGAILINVGRGTTVDSDALVEALRSGKIFGAGLDVTDPEPLPADHPLWGEPGAIITPHNSGKFSLPKTLDNIVDIFIHNLKRYAEGLPLDNQVNRTTRYAADQNGGHRLLSTL